MLQACLGVGRGVDMAQDRSPPVFGRWGKHGPLSIARASFLSPTLYPLALPASVSLSGSTLWLCLPHGLWLCCSSSPDSLLAWLLVCGLYIFFYLLILCLHCRARTLVSHSKYLYMNLSLYVFVCLSVCPSISASMHRLLYLFLTHYLII